MGRRHRWAGGGVAPSTASLSLSLSLSLFSLPLPTTVYTLLVMTSATVRSVEDGPVARDAARRAAAGARRGACAGRGGGAWRGGAVAAAACMAGRGVVCVLVAAGRPLPLSSPLSRPPALRALPGLQAAGGTPCAQTARGARWDARPRAGAGRGPPAVALRAAPARLRARGRPCRRRRQPAASPPASPPRAIGDAEVACSARDAPRPPPLHPITLCRPPCRPLARGTPPRPPRTPAAPGARRPAWRPP